MLKKILSISGKPGLYKLISHGKNLIIVESLIDKKRTPAYSRDKIIALGDIAIYTETEEVPLAKVFETLTKNEEGKAIDAKKYTTTEAMKDFFTEILPDYDKARV